MAAGEKVLLLGGGGGVGSAVARQLVAGGTAVFLAGRDASRLATIGQELSVPHGMVDAADFDAVDALADRAVETLGGLTGIVNCVGSILLKPAHLTSAAEWQATLAANLTSGFAAVRTAGRLLLVTAEHSAIIKEVASWHHDPAGVAEPEFVVATTVIHLAQILARAAAAGSTAESKAVHARLAAPDYPAWQLLQERGVSLPFDPPERIDTLASIAATCPWAVNHFIENAAGGEVRPGQSPALLAG